MKIQRSMIARYVPNALAPYGRRVLRRIDQLAGYPSSGRRLGVVAMLHVGRCGSTVLANLLDQHPKIFWDGKIYRKAKCAFGYDIAKMDYRSWTRSQFLAAGAKYYGFEFKILKDQYPSRLGVSLENFLAECKSMGVTHFILLVRRNTLRHVVSHYASKNRGRWHLSTSDKISRQQFELDISNITTGSAAGRPLPEYLQEVEEAHDTVRDALRHQTFLEVGYETDIEARGAVFAYEKICAFLDLEPEKVMVKNQKVNPFPVRDTVLNYDQIVASLVGTKFEWMLHEGAAKPGNPQDFGVSHAPIEG